MNRIRDFLRTRRPNGRDGGYSTETVLVIAVLAVLALGAVGTIASKVETKVSTISLGD